MEYLRRIADDELELRLNAFGGVQIKGPKWCGKTTTALQHAASVVQMQDPDRREGYLATARSMPSLLLKGPTPRLIDEWQVAPVIWDAVRHAVDERGLKGQFILTGSTVVDDAEIMHTGTGRISTLTMYPMSLFESGESTGSVSLRALFDGDTGDLDNGATADLSMERLIFAACRGGWPAALDASMDDEARLLIARDYVDVICQEDLSRVDKVKRKPTLARLVLRSYARNLCTLAKRTVLLKDVAGEMEGTSLTTLDDYIGALERLFVVGDVDAWCPAIRSATVIRSGRKRCLVDPSIAVAAMGLSPRSLELDLRTFGFVYECMCIRDLRAYSQSMGGHLSYYHDRYGLEADAVLHLRDGRYALIECKLGSRDIDEGARHLLALRDLIALKNRREEHRREEQCPLRLPDLMIVLTGGEFAYRRPDGVMVIPLAALRP